MINIDMNILDNMALRFNPLPTNDVYLDSRYDWQKYSNGVEWPYYRFFYHLAKWVKPKVTVELGGWQGTAAAHLAGGYRDGIVITIDHHSDPGDDMHQSLMVDAEKRYSNMLYSQGWSNPVVCEQERGKHFLQAETVYDDLLYHLKTDELTIDILFIDSWHHYDQAMLDWEYYKPLLSKNALVVCDDIQSGDIEESPISGMVKFWEQMPKPKFLNSNLHPGTGMGFAKVTE